MSVAVARAEVFTRKASGLVRVMSPYSAFMYNILTMGLIFPWTYLWGPSAFPGGDLALGVLLCILLQLPLSLGYSWLATAMPRSGGDYVFQSRILGGGFGFTVVFGGLVIWVLQWVALSGWLMAVLGIAPLLMGLGATLSSPGLIELGKAVQSPTGIVVVSILFSALATLLLVSGFKNYVKLQYFLFYATIASFLTMLYLFLRATPEQFAEGINRFVQAVQGTESFYQKTIQDVVQAGWNVRLPFSWWATLMIAPIAWTSLQWSTYSCEQGSEIQGANNFRNQLFINVGSMVVTGVLLALLGWAEVRAVGSEFLSAAAAAYYGGVGPGLGDIQPFPNILALGLTTSPLVVLLIGLGYICNSFQIFCNCYIGMTRNIVAMALDRVLPEWCSRVHPRLRTPVNAHVVYFIGGVIWTLIYNYVPNWTQYTLGVTFANGAVFVLSGGLAAMLLPYRARRQYEAAPVPKGTVLGIPLVSVIGALGLLTGGWMVLAFLIYPQYGLTGPVAQSTVIGILLLALIWYLLAKSYQAKRGINIAYAFAEIPPE